MASSVPDLVLVDGLPGGVVSASDRGLHYGDGLFETLPVIAGEARHWDRHLQRLRLGCVRLGIPCPQETLLRADLEALCTGVERAVLKLIVTRGSGGRGYRPPAQAAATRVFARYPWPSHAPDLCRSGIVVRVCATRLAHNPALAGLKHLNRLEQVLARREWDDPGIHESLMLDGDGRVIEGTMSNLFIVREGRLTTPDLSRCGVLGIMRQLVIDRAARAGMATEIRAMDLAEVMSAEGAFLCNSVVGLWPIAELRGARTHHYAPCDAVARLARALGRDAGGGA